MADIDNYRLRLSENKDLLKKYETEAKLGESAIIRYEELKKKVAILEEIVSLADEENFRSYMAETRAKYANKNMADKDMIMRLLHVLEVVNPDPAFIYQKIRLILE